MPVTRKRASVSELDDGGKHNKIASTSALSAAKRRASESARRKRKPSEEAKEQKLDAQPRRRDASKVDIFGDDAELNASDNDSPNTASSSSVPSRSLSGVPPRLGRRAMAELSTPRESLSPRTRAAPRSRLPKPLTVSPTPFVPSSRKSVAAESDVKATNRTIDRSAVDDPVASERDAKMPLAVGSEAGRAILHTLQDGHAPSKLETSAAQDAVSPPLLNSEPTSKVPSASNKGPFTNASAPRVQDASKHSATSDAPTVLKPGGPPEGTASGSKGSQFGAPSGNAKETKTATERKHVCDEPRCGRAFLRSEHLKRHKASLHSIEKSHKCPHEGCRRAFSRHDNLRQHMRTHVPKEYRVGAMMPAYYMTDELPPAAEPSTFGHSRLTPDIVPTAAVSSVRSAFSPSDSSRSVSLEASEVLTGDPQEDEEFLAAYFPSAALSPYSSYRPAFSRPILTNPNRKSSTVDVAATALPVLTPSGPVAVSRKGTQLLVDTNTAAATPETDNRTTMIGAKAADGQSYEGVYESDSGSEVSMGA